MTSRAVSTLSESQANKRSLNSEAQSQRSKRVRIMQACEECRVRKIRCDGAAPVCGACTRRRSGNRNCTYKPEKSKDELFREHVARLESRIQELETQSNNADRREQSAEPHIPPMILSSLPPVGLVAPHHHLPVLDEEDVATEEGTLPSEPNLLPTVSTFDFIGQEDSGPRLSELVEENDGMGNVGTIGGSGMEGSSSAASFMKQIRDAVAAKICIPRDSALGSRPPHLNTVSAMDDMTPWYFHRVIAENCVLPAREKADQMLDVYWTEIHVLYPFLHRPQFMKIYRDLWTAEGPTGNIRTIHCILNIVFALCSQVTKRQAIQEHEVAADVFFRRALLLLQVDMINTASLELIQALLLVGKYLQSTEWPQRCWAMVGLAIRVAQGLGLHLPETSASQRHQRDREMARRLWHGCVFMDRVTAMTLGRPMMISNSDAGLVPLPASIDDDHLSVDPGHDAEQKLDQPSTIAFFVASVQLYSITGRVLSTMYPSMPVKESRVGLSLTEKLELLDFHEILRLNDCLTKWNDSLPGFLGTSSAGSTSHQDPVFTRQANILHIRYLHLQILLFRPLLSHLLGSEFQAKLHRDSAPALWLPQAMALPCARKCVLAAEQVIQLIHDNQSDDNSVEALPIWWYQVFFVYSAVTAIIPALVYEPLRGEIPKCTLVTSWKHSLHILRRLSTLSTSARHCMAALEFLNGYIVRDADERAPVQVTAELGHGHQLSQQTALNNFGSDFDDPTLLPTMSATGFQMPGDFEEDTSWLESSPADLLASRYGDLSKIYSN